VEILWGVWLRPGSERGYSILQKCVQPHRRFFAVKMVGFSNIGKDWVFVV
jgi:hypothetical protein